MEISHYIKKVSARPFSDDFSATGDFSPRYLSIQNVKICVRASCFMIGNFTVFFGAKMLRDWSEGALEFQARSNLRVGVNKQGFRNFVEKTLRSRILKKLSQLLATSIRCFYNEKLNVMKFYCFLLKLHV